MATKLWPNRQKSDQNGHDFSCIRHMNAWSCERVSVISEFICDTPVHKGQRGVTTATNFGTKIAINAFLREISLIDNRGFLSLAIPNLRHFQSVS